jgi:signal transduction histidine kinase
MSPCYSQAWLGYAHCRPQSGASKVPFLAMALGGAVLLCMEPIMARIADACCVEQPLGGEPAQVSRSRQRTGRALADWGLGDLAEIAELVVSELVTNAQQHGAGPLHMRLGLGHGVLRVEVHDCGPGRPVCRRPSPSDERGRGLSLLDALISVHGGARGVVDDLLGPGKTVYVDLPIADAAVAAVAQVSGAA